ncbi:CocE/NonD family hydrolase [Nocardia sp. NPDC006630]|uniref:CocE/NonD family hydrolase n=1 Tax=Nocardia sp. NPDC006630 TaxID=3157181 RepID=UPI0033AAB458
MASLPITAVPSSCARPRYLSGALAVLTALLLAVGVSAPAPAPAEPVDDAAVWTATHDGPQPFPNVHTDWDVPITMSDGVVLKANVYRPADAAGIPATEQTPAIVNLTPYSKLTTTVVDAVLGDPALSGMLTAAVAGFDLSGVGLSGYSDLAKALAAGALRNFGVDRKLVESGYTQVVVDVRGTGFSEGDWQVFGEREQQDGVEVVNWAAAQPWSTGTVGMNGLSYSAANQLQTAERKPAALRAIFPVVPGSDMLHDIIATGGGFGVGFMPTWLASVNALKLVPDLQALFTGNFDGQWLRDRMRDPFTDANVLLATLAAPSLAGSPELTEMLNGDSPLRRSLDGHPEQVSVPTFVYGGWQDIFAYSATRIYNAIDVPAEQKKLIMGDTYHLTTGAGLGLPGGPPRLDVLQRAWFDKWLKGIDNGIDRFDPVTLWQQGGNWVNRQQFPSPGMDYRRLYLDPAPSGTALSVHDGSLRTEPGGAALLTVAPGLTGLCSREAAVGTAGETGVLDICAKDARINETNGLTFTSAPVGVPTEISGPIAVHLNTMLDAADGFWSATVNDVAPDGRSTVWTSGQLQASLRKVNEDRATRSPNGDYTDPYPALTLDTRQDVVPGRPTIVDIGMPATDGVLQPGHRLRVDIYAFDVLRGLPMRPMLDASGLKPEHLQLDPNDPSWVNIPAAGQLG